MMKKNATTPKSSSIEQEGEMMRSFPHIEAINVKLMAEAPYLNPKTVQEALEAIIELNVYSNSLFMMLAHLAPDSAADYDFVIREGMQEYLQAIREGML